MDILTNKQAERQTHPYIYLILEVNIEKVAVIFFSLTNVKNYNL